MINYLTPTPLLSNLSLSPTMAARDWHHGISGRIAAFHAVFLCVKLKLYMSMSGWVGSRKAGWFLDTGMPTYSVRRPDWHQLAGNSLFLGVTRMNTLTQKPRVSLSDLILRQSLERGLEPMPLESELLLSRIRQGGHSGQFLADAFLSAYRSSVPFEHSLAELIKLDAEGFRLFHQILHIRHIPNWSDDPLYQIERQIKAILPCEISRMAVQS